MVSLVTQNHLNEMIGFLQLNQSLGIEFNLVHAVVLKTLGLVSAVVRKNTQFILKKMMPLDFFLCSSGTIS